MQGQRIQAIFAQSAGTRPDRNTRVNRSALLIIRNYGTGFDVFAALFRAIGERAKKKPAE
jgi:hypothetical protein